MKRTLFLSLLLLILSATAEARVLHLVTSLNPIEAKDYITEFERASGIKVEWIRLSAGEVAARLKAEGDKTTQSVWFGGPLPEYVSAKDDGLLKAFKPRNVKGVPQRWRDPDGYWTGIYYGYIGFVSNTDFLKRHRLAVPESWNDLLSPGYRGWITLSYPYTAGTGFTIFAGLVSLMGEDGAIEYWKRLDKSIHHYTKSGSAPVVEVGLGEAGVGVAFSQDILAKGTQRKFPVVMSFPMDGIPFEVGCVAILKGAPEEKEAREFVEWIISLPAQDMMQKWARVPIVTGAEIKGEFVPPSGVKLIDMDFVGLGKKRSALIERWRMELEQ